MARNGRPKVPGSSVYVRLSPQNAEALDRYIGRSGEGPGRMSKTSVINWALKKFFEEVEKTT